MRLIQLLIIGLAIVGAYYLAVIRPRHQYEREMRARRERRRELSGAYDPLEGDPDDDHHPNHGGHRS